MYGCKLATVAGLVTVWQISSYWLMPSARAMAPSGWQLVFQDDFSGPDIDMSVWSHEVNGDGGGNNELQYYTDSHKNSRIENGKLIIEAHKENYEGRSYTSARLRTKGKQDWKFGRFEIRAKMPSGKGMWPAIWMLPTENVYGIWPRSGEIDIVELLGHETKKIHGTIHFGEDWSTRQQRTKEFELPSGDFSDEFHTFVLEWEENELRWYVDEENYHTTQMTGKPFDQKFHLLMNVAVGGNWPGAPDDSTTFPQRMEVEYVRVYERR